MLVKSLIKGYILEDDARMLREHTKLELVPFAYICMRVTKEAFHHKNGTAKNDRHRYRGFSQDHTVEALRKPNVMSLTSTMKPRSVNWTLGQVLTH